MPVLGRSARGGAPAGQTPVVRIACERSGLMVDTCRATRVLAPALLVAIVVSSVGGSDLVAWIAAAATVAAILGVQRVRGTAPACGVRPPQAPTPPQRCSPTETTATLARRAPRRPGDDSHVRSTTGR
jgi:hypothetical protein